MSTAMANKTIGQLIKEERERADVSQNQLAKQAGISQASLSRIESGRQNPTIPTLREIAKVLGVDCRDLLS